MNTTERGTIYAENLVDQQRPRTQMKDVKTKTDSGASATEDLTPRAEWNDVLSALATPKLAGPAEAVGSVSSCSLPVSSAEDAAAMLERMAWEETKACVSMWLPWRGIMSEIRASAYEAAALKIRAEIARAKERQPEENKELGEVGKTSRGFEIIRFADRYVVPCSLQMSSLADNEAPGTSAVWLGCDFDILPQATVTVTPRMHLDRKQVAALVGHLSRWLETGSFR